MKAAKKTPKGLDLGTYRQAIDDAVDAGGFIDYRSAHDYAQSIEDAINSLEELLKEGHAAEYHRRKRHEEAMAIKEEFETEKALGYLIGEKLVNFVRAADKHPEFARELPNSAGRRTLGGPRVPGEDPAERVRPRVHGR